MIDQMKYLQAQEKAIMDTQFNSKDKNKIQKAIRKKYQSLP